MQDCHEMIADHHLTGQGERWSVSLIVKFQVASSLSVAKRIVGAYETNRCITSLYGVLLCHDASSFRLTPGSPPAIMPGVESLDRT